MSCCHCTDISLSSHLGSPVNIPVAEFPAVSVFADQEVPLFRCLSGLDLGEPGTLIGTDLPNLSRLHGFGILSLCC
jgi:hypothetical protein